MIILVLVVLLSQTIDAQQKILLSVYYESKCPDSRDFIQQQLVPTMSVLHDYLQLRLIPFGKAKSINTGQGGFECQHGPTECLGNMVQDCVIRHMAGRPDIEVLNYVACEMQSYAATTGDLQCVRKANVPEQSVQYCLSGRAGTNLQLFSEYLTNLVRPRFVPTVTINERFDQAFQDKSQHNLFGTLCSMMPGVRPCAQHFNYQALRTLLY